MVLKPSLEQAANREKGGGTAGFWRLAAEKGRYQVSRGCCALGGASFNPVGEQPCSDHGPFDKTI